MWSVRLCGAFVCADRRKMLQGRFKSGKLESWYLSNRCKISKLPPSFGALVCSGNLDLDVNKLESLPERFSEITLVGNLGLGGNPQLTGVPENFPNVKGKVIH